MEGLGLLYEVISGIPVVTDLEQRYQTYNTAPCKGVMEGPGLLCGDIKHSYRFSPEIPDLLQYRNV